MKSTAEEKRQFLEDWGPFMLSGIPMLLALFAAFTSNPTRPLRLDPLLYFMVMACLLGVGFLIANLFGRRAVGGLRVLAILGVLIVLPALFVPGITLPGVARLCAIGVAWGMIALIGKYKGFWWITKPLEKLNGYASMPEEWAKEWIAEMYADDEIWDNPELALERARADWDAMLSGEDGEVVRVRRQKGPTLGDRIWAFIKDEPLQTSFDPADEAANIKARRAAASKIEIDPDDYSPTARLLRKYQSTGKNGKPVEDENWIPPAFAHDGPEEESERPPMWRRLLFGEKDSPEPSETKRASNWFRRNESHTEAVVEMEEEPVEEPPKKAKSREEKRLEKLNEARLQAKL